MRVNKMAHITPLMDFAMVSTLCSLLEGLLTKDHCPPGTDKDVYEAYFQYACVWAFGGAFGADKALDSRKVFSDWWRGEWAKTTFKWPEEGLVFDYYVEPATQKAAHWRDAIQSYTHATGEGSTFSSIVVPTMDTTRLTFMIDLLMALQKPVMLVGTAGSAKTTIIQDKLSQLPDELMFFGIAFNSYTDAASLQAILEQPLEKKTGVHNDLLPLYLQDCSNCVATSTVRSQPALYPLQVRCSRHRGRSVSSTLLMISTCPRRTRTAHSLPLHFSGSRSGAF
jgi:dynein heavy chain